MRIPFSSTRRHAVISGLAIAGGCFVGLNMRTLLSEAHAAKKPLLTQANLTALMRRRNRLQIYAELANDRNPDLSRFLGRHFLLTDAQIKEIRSIPPEQVAELKRSARQRMEKLMDEANNLSAEAQKKSEDAADIGKLPIRMRPNTTNRKTPSRRIKLSTTFDGNVLKVTIR